MADLKIGWLFKKHNIKYNKEKIDVYELKDYVVGIGFTNTDRNDFINIIGGHYSGEYASFAKAHNNETNLVFLPDTLGKALEANNNQVDFDKIRNQRIKTTGEYYMFDKEKQSLSLIINPDMIMHIKKELKKDQGDFDETELEKTSDISTMYSSIKKTIISQDEQIMQILTALFKNQKVINSNLDKDLIAKLKENILIFGSTGTGKTEILKRISKLYNIPLVIEDATSLSETGYVGRKVTDLLEDLYAAADGDIELAEKGVLVIDEFDKLAEKEGDGQTHVSRLGVQRSLLKLLDGTLFYLGDKKFDTSKLTVVGLGAFTGIIDGDDYKDLTTDDFMRYGIMRELIGRFSKTIAMNPLSKDDIIKILKESDFSPLNSYKQLFEILDVQFEFNDDFIEYIAQLAIAKQSGARSLKTVFDDCISGALFRIFAGEYSSISLVKPSDDNDKPYVLTKTKDKKSGIFGKRK